MSTYCECGHVWSSHADINENNDGELEGGICLDPDGCECEQFTEESVAEFDTGWD